MVKLTSPVEHVEHVGMLQADKVRGHIPGTAADPRNAPPHLSRPKARKINGSINVCGNCLPPTARDQMKFMPPTVLITWLATKPK